MANRSLLALALLLFQLTGSVLSRGFEEWCSEHGKSYGSDEETGRKREVFYKNAELVEWLNEQHKDDDVTFELNHFADLTPSEFKTSILLRSQSPPLFSPELYLPLPSHPETLPDTFDWREKGVVSSVKDQGSVGSCWAFSTVGNVEGQWALAGNKVVSLSAEQLVDCDATFDPNNLHQDCGVFGGWPYLAYQYIEKTGGIESEADYPYCSGTGDCFPCVPTGYNKTRCGPAPEYCNKTQGCTTKLDPKKFVSGLKVKSWVAIAKNESAMQAELVSRGPLSVLINAQELQFYHSGVWDPKIFGCDPTDLDHAVLLVGYGDYKGLLSTKPYWLIKNSWGEKWGQNGYFMLIRGEGKCGVDQAVTCAVLG